VLIVLAAAQRDPQADLLAFGHAGHACPGARMAHAIAHTAVRELVAQIELPRTWSYRSSVNLRIPRFAETSSS
jgi:cytochrome P450